MVGQALYLTCLVLLLVSITSARNPGLKARITKKGLTYANTVAIQSLQESVKKTTIPDQSGKASGFKYNVYSMRITAFTPPTSSIDLVTGRGLAWVASGAFIELNGKFNYKKWVIKGSGSFTAKVSGVNFNLQLNIGDDGTGRPNISAGKCVASVGGVDFKFHGGASWLYNLFRGKVGKAIKGKLNDVMCPMVTNAVNVDAEKKMKDLPMTSVLAKKFLLDYLLTAKPEFTPSYLETFHKGEVLWRETPTASAPMTAPAIPASSDTSRMLYLWLSDYVIDTFLFQAQTHGQLVHNLTAKDLPPDNRGVLNTTCTGIVPNCIGKFIKAIGEKYPNSTVELRMNSTQIPDLSISSSGVTVKFGGSIDMYAHVPGQTTTPFLITLLANMSANVNVSVGNQKLFASISDVKLNLKAGRSAVGPVDDKFLNFLIDSALNVFIIPQINAAGREGFPLPVTKQITFINTTISFAKDTIQVATDLKYNPTTALSPEVNKPEAGKPEVRPLKVPTNTDILQTLAQELQLKASDFGGDMEELGPLKFQSLVRKFTQNNEAS